VIARFDKPDCEEAVFCDAAVDANQEILPVDLNALFLQI